MDKHKKLDFCRLKNAIIDTAKSVQSALGDYIVAPTKKKPSLACHSELQLSSYIVVLFKLRYEITTADGLVDRGNKAKEIREVRRFLYKHYLYDILRGYWSGSGDTKLEEIIADPFTCRYVKDVNKDSFEQAISEWLASSNKKSSLMTVSAETKLFLNYLLRLYNNPAAIAKTDYDIEHCVPKKVLQTTSLRKMLQFQSLPPARQLWRMCAVDHGNVLSEFQLLPTHASTYYLRCPVRWSHHWGTGIHIRHSFFLSVA